MAMRTCRTALRSTRPSAQATDPGERGDMTSPHVPSPPCAGGPEARSPRAGEPPGSNPRGGARPAGGCIRLLFRVGPVSEKSRLLRQAARAKDDARRR